MNETGTVTITNSTFTGNSAPSGGGIHIIPYNGVTATVSNSTFSGNSATTRGGGINTEGTLFANRQYMPDIKKFGSTDR